MSRVVVTGGAGYIGSVVSALLLREGYQVDILDNLSNGHRAAVPEGARLWVGQVDDAALLGRLLPGAEAVLHFAASIDVAESMRDPMAHFHNNTAVAFRLLHAMQEHRVERLVFSSTAALYGNPDTVPIAESAPLRPTNAYGESKLLVERALSWLHAQRGLRYMSLRYFNAAGGCLHRGEDHHPETHLIPIVLEVAQDRRPHLTIFGHDYPTRDGTAVRDYIHVEDLASAHLLALRALEQRSQGIFNLGNGVGFTVQEVVEVARRVTGHPIPTVLAPRRDGDPAELVASSQAIREQLGWRPRHPDLESIVRSAWEWRKAHPHGYRAPEAGSAGPIPGS